MIESEKLFGLFAQYTSRYFDPEGWDLFIQETRKRHLYGDQDLINIKSLHDDHQDMKEGLIYNFIQKVFSSLGNTEEECLITLEKGVPNLVEWALFDADEASADDFYDVAHTNWEILPLSWQEGALQGDIVSRFPSGSFHLVESQESDSTTSHSNARSIETSRISSKFPTTQKHATNHSRQKSSTTSKKEEKMKPIFIIHGHNDKRKDELYSFLHDLTNIKPIILHKQANKGETIIEKLVRIGNDAGFAIALLTADDVGRSASSLASDEKPRGRQNVVFEAGYFMALLGRKNVILLKDNNVEDIGDLKGVVYESLDSTSWKKGLATELEEAGYKIDWKSL